MRRSCEPRDRWGFGSQGPGSAARAGAHQRRMRVMGCGLRCGMVGRVQRRSLGSGIPGLAWRIFGGVCILGCGLAYLASLPDSDGFAKAINLPKYLELPVLLPDGLGVFLSNQRRGQCQGVRFG